MSNKLTGSMNSSQGKIDLRNMPNIKCDECESDVFKQVIFIKKISALLSPNGQEVIVPVQAFACDKCGHVNKDIRKAFETGEIE